MRRVRPGSLRTTGTNPAPGLLWAAVLAACALLTVLAWVLLDGPAARWALEHRDLPPWSSLRGALGPLILIQVLLLLVPPALALRRGRRVAASVFLVLLAALALSTLTSFIIKRVVLRPRPAALYAAPPGGQIGGSSRHSFPSGDVLVDTAMVVALWGLLGRRRGWGWLLVVPVAVGAQRFIAAAHFPSDILAGWTLGAVIGVLVLRVPASRTAEEAMTVR